MYITKWTTLIIALISVCYVAHIECDEITANEHVRIINFIYSASLMESYSFYIAFVYYVIK